MNDYPPYVDNSRAFSVRMRNGFVEAAFAALGVFLLITTANPAWGQDRAQGTISFDIADVLQKPLETEVHIHPLPLGRTRIYEFPDGTGEITLVEGRYRVLTHVRSGGPLILVDWKEIDVRAEKTSYVLVSLLEGAGGNLELSAFDNDLDGVLDRLEAELGTDPQDPMSTPGFKPFVWESPVLDEAGAWYKGDFHVHSNHGRGSQSVQELIREAERRGLDFLAITDRNTLASTRDPDYKSNKVVLVPGIEWGDEERGLGLVFAPASVPQVPTDPADADALAIRIQARGGIFVAAHPCFPTAPFQWPIQYVNGIEVWCRDWRGAPPLSVGLLEQPLQEKLIFGERSRYKYPIAHAANSSGISANGQASVYWDLQMMRGYRSSAIAGSNSASKKVPIGQPLTYVYATEKSLNGILDGLRRGRTFVTSGPDGPTIDFQADIGADDSIEIGVGGVIPTNTTTRFIIGIHGAKGKKVEVLLNGTPIRGTNIPTSNFNFVFAEVPNRFGAYRVRVLERAEGPGFGPAEVYAMSSAIYAHGILVDPEEPSRTGWVDIESSYVDQSVYENYLPADANTYEIPLKSIR